MTITALAVDCLQQPDPHQIAARWATVDCCPACGSEDADSCGAIPDSCYVFGSECVPLANVPVTVMRCGDCGLVYKSAVPSPAFLARLFERQAGEKWATDHDFAAEAAMIRRLVEPTGTIFDLLDVGAAGGALLKACSGNAVTARRSALDVLRYPGIEAQLAGEFIEGFLDDPSLAWSGQPYDVVTAFDVVEHLYRPRTAFENLHSLVKPEGLVLIESGNIGNFWPRHYGINQWWYVRLLEHHIFWSRRSLERMAARCGFEMVSWKEIRHKSRQGIFRSVVATDLLKVGFYCVARNHYSTIARCFGRQGNQPWFPFARDHFQACLRRK